MDIKKLIPILDAVKLGSFNKAAAKHGYTSSALIYIADGLENELGVRIIERSSFGIRPTAEGEVLLPKLKELADKEDEIKKKAKSLASKKNTVIIGCYSSVAKSFLSEKLARIRRELPTVEISLVIKDSLAKMRESGAEIFILGRREVGERGCIPLYTDNYVAVVANKALAAKESLLPDDFRGTPFIMPCDSAVIKAFSNLDNEIINVSADDDSAIIEMVRDGIGSTVLTSRAVGKNKSGIYTVPLSPEIKNEIVLYTDKDTKEIKKIIKMLIEA